MEGLIIENISNLYKVKVKNDIYKTIARGKLKKEDITPVVGDIVELEEINQEKKEAVIRKNF